MPYYVYMMSNWNSRVLYIGMTNNLFRRVEEHQSGTVEGFTRKYRTDRLVYMEEYPTAYEAISREKMLKGWLRKRKNELVETINPNWQDLAKTL